MEQDQRVKSAHILIANGNALVYTTGLLRLHSFLRHASIARVDKIEVDPVSKSLARDLSSTALLDESLHLNETIMRFHRAAIEAISALDSHAISSYSFHRPKCLRRPPREFEHTPIKC
jgi:hypothetical protein